MANTDVTIEYLADHPMLARTVSNWVFSEWGWMFPGIDEDQFFDRLWQRSQNRGEVPCSFVALTAGQPVGTASLVHQDLPTHSHLSPWLAAVFVAPESRRRGIGSRLVERVMLEAKELSVGSLYLYTPDMMPFYEQLGWTIIERSHYKGEDICIMSVDSRNLV